MSLLSEDERALVASQVAALRKRGWPASRAVDLVARRLRRGPLQRLRRASRASSLRLSLRDP